MQKAEKLFNSAQLSYDCLIAPVAQWIEYLASNQGVGGSNPSGRTKITKPTHASAAYIFVAPGGIRKPERDPSEYAWERGRVVRLQARRREQNA